MHGIIGILILILFTLVFSKDKISFQSIKNEDGFKPDTEWIAKDKFIIRSVVVDTVIIKIDTTYDHSYNHTDSLQQKNNNWDRYKYFGGSVILN
jgi:hypothetical protein